MTPAGRSALMAPALLFVLTTVAIAQPAGPKPEYLPYADLAPDDSGPRLAAKKAYNDAVERYNKALYEYFVTLERHDQLVERHQRSSTVAEQEQAKAEAAPLRAKLEGIRKSVLGLARAVDESRRRAASTGVTLPR